MPKNPWSVRLPALWADQNGCCCYCGQWTLMMREALHLPGPVCYRAWSIIWQGGTYGIASVDHLTPRSMGGRNRLSNLVMACKKCNNKRNEVLQKKPDEETP